MYILLLANPYGAENAPDEESKVSNVQLQSSTEAVFVEEHLGFVQAFLKTLSVIFVSEIGDKTFFIAAIMAMKHPRLMVFLGAMSALAFMTVISVLGGWAMSVVPKKYTYYGSVILFFLFGIKMIIDGMRMSPNEGQEEYEEVQAELRKKEEERAKKAKRKTKKEAVYPVIEAEIPVLQVLPVPSEVTENSTMIKENGNEIIVTKAGQEEGKVGGQMQCDTNSKGGQPTADGKGGEPPANGKVGLPPTKVEKSGIMETLKLLYIALFEKETLTKDVEAGRVDKNSKVTILRVLSHIVVQAFTLTFVAEWGDRSQLATFLLAAKDNKFGITLGGIAGHSICTGIAVTGGRFVAQKISVKTVTILGGVVFIACALITFFLESSESEAH
ncbi:hypothetical protein V9T40_012561 [Parthenolecanium corni]|uniref:GDT1 family protein n=1 Tax=Parthenolecanium corni TaxID=536013 RepID=A0AAN9T7Z9_9HEMI